MIWHIMISGFSLGILSSFHCIGMCGPIALSIPFHDSSNQKKIVNSLLYNLGRILTYAIMGLLFGLIGRGFFLSGLQQFFSITIGIVILFFLFLNIFNKSYIISQKLNQKIQKLILFFLNKKQRYKVIFLGMANGLLPCGMVYLAIAAAVASGYINSSILFMLFFGLGTFPTMITISLFRFSIQQKPRNFIRKLMPFIIAIMGLLLIARGLNLGIPYLSPQIQVNSPQNAACN